MIKLTYQDFYYDMGLVAEPLIANPGWIWAQKAWIGMGNRLHGDSLATTWKEGAQPSGAGGPSNPNYATLTTTPWEDISGWFGALPAVANTCTNAAIEVWDFQVQWFDLTDSAWKLIGDNSYLYRTPLTVNIKYWTTDTFTADGFADKLFLGRYNNPAFCCTKQPADRSAADSFPSTPGKYRIIHNALPRAGLDWAKIGGIAVMCKAKISPIPGAGSLNGDPRIYLQAGADYWPRHNQIANVNGELLDGITNIPAVGAGRLKKLLTTEQTFLFVTANINPDTYKEPTSVYVNSFPAGTYPNCMTDAMFQGHVPQFMTF